jgi:hypothetical protein
MIVRAGLALHRGQIRLEVLATQRVGPEGRKDDEVFGAGGRLDGATRLLPVDVGDLPRDLHEVGDELEEDRQIQFPRDLLRDDPDGLHLLAPELFLLEEAGIVEGPRRFLGENLNELKLPRIDAVLTLEVLKSQYGR